MSDQTMTSVANAISALPNPCPPITLIKHYRGTALNQQVDIVDMNSISGTIRATQRLTFPILSGMIHLRSGAFPGAISASIQPLDYTDGTFQLYDLSYGNWQDRKGERVQPKTPTYVTMSFGRKTFRAVMDDISADGAGILANRNVDPGNKLLSGTKLLLKFHLKPSIYKIHLKGSVVYRKDIGQKLIRFGLHLFPDTDQRKFLRAYISRRHDEILHELEQDYFRLYDAYRIENQYF